MPNPLTHDVLILGAGLAGLRAAVEISRNLGGNVDIGIVSKVQLMRAHSVCAEGGTACMLRPEEGDSYELHAWDSVKGSDFLADQDVIDRFGLDKSAASRHLRQLRANELISERREADNKTRIYSLNPACIDTLIHTIRALLGK